MPGPYEGVELMVLRTDEASGGGTVLRKFWKGVTVPAHIHREANETAYILSGEWEEDGQVYTEGTLFHAPRGIRHGGLHRVRALPVVRRGRRHGWHGRPFNG